MIGNEKIRMSTSQQTLFFGVGSTKSGTSWLYETCCAHPEIYMRTIKELHFFDSVQQGRLDRQIGKVRAERDMLTLKFDKASLRQIPDLAQKVADRTDWIDVLQDGGKHAYLRYLRRGSGDARVVGEVTPAYALLPQERLRQMAGLVNDVRVVYLIRDPVERLWSHVRMIAMRRGNGRGVEPARAARILARTIAGKENEISARGDYAAALKKLDATLTRDKLLVAFYEEMVTADGVARLWDFLGVSVTEVDVTRRVHDGTPLQMPRDLRDAALVWLEPQYEAVIARMDRLPEQWHTGAMKLRRRIGR